MVSSNPYVSMIFWVPVSFSYKSFKSLCIESDCLSIPLISLARDFSLSLNDANLVSYSFTWETEEPEVEIISCSFSRNPTNSWLDAANCFSKLCKLTSISCCSSFNLAFSSCKVLVSVFSCDSLAARLTCCDLFSLYSERIPVCLFWRSYFFSLSLADSFVILMCSSSS